VKRAVLVCLLAAAPAFVPASAFAQTPTKTFRPRFEVIPQLIDNRDNVVQSGWLAGIGCLNNPTDPTQAGFSCTNPFDRDPNNQGLLMAKSNASFPAGPGQAVAIIKGVKGSFVDIVGYDLRKPYFDNINSISGSHCTSVSPRWEFTMADGSSFFIPIACGDPAEIDLSNPAAQFWQRLRWPNPNPTSTAPIWACRMPVSANAKCDVDIRCSDPRGCGVGKRMQSLRIVHDEFDSPDLRGNFGIAIFDNIFVDGGMKGSGPGPRNGDEDEGQGRDQDGREFYHMDSASHPEQSQFEFHDPVANVNLVGVGGVTGIAYSVGPLGQPCVSFNGNATNNGKAGYVYSFLSCDLSAIGSDLGTYTITATGPLGTLPYNQTGSLIMGNVTLHK
jgi:hypothetical protein